MKEKEHKKRLEIEKSEKQRGRLPIDYNYLSTEDEAELSEYEITDKELYPTNKRPLVKENNY